MSDTPKTAPTNQGTAPAPDKRATLVYFGDAMCSWCYGFAPELERLRAALGERVGLRLYAGGLRPYTREPMDAARKAKTREHWTHVARASGRAFDQAFFEREGFVYDTEPASRAVVTLRALAPEAAHEQALDYLHAIQRAFYAGNRDVTDEDTLAALASAFGQEHETFLEQLRSDAMKQAVREDFAAAARIGVTGFPTVLLETAKQTYLVTQGYVPADELIAVLEPVIAREANA